VVEDEVHAIPLVADAQAPLAADETEIAAKFQQAVLEMVDQRRFEVGLRILVAQAEEL
jgi:hypothetical protein